MRKDLPHILVYSFQGIKDPLFRGLILQYLRDFNTPEPRFCFHIITHEQAMYRANREEQEAFRKELAQWNIQWHPINYHNGRFLLLKKLYDFLHSLFVAAKIRFKYRTRFFIGYLTIAGAFGYLISRLLRMRLLVFCFEPHSDYMIDFGTWSRTSLKYSLLNTLEKREATRCDYLTVPTRHTQELVEHWGTRAKKIFRLPISVDTGKFIFCPEKRQEIRSKYNFTGRRAIFYLGKFRGIYYDVPEVVAFYGELRRQDPNIFAYVITPNIPEEIEDALLQEGFTRDDFVVLGKVPYEEVADYISAADLGLVAIPPLPSQRYRTPVKVGNYLACGVPLLIPKGIADDDELTENEKVGVVVREFSVAEAKRIQPELDALWNEPEEQLRARCREVAIRARGLQNTKKVLEQIFEDVFKKK